MPSHANAFSPSFYDWRAQDFRRYDPRVVFDDVLGDDIYDNVRGGDEIIDMAGSTLRALDRRRLRRQPHRVEAVGFDSTQYSFAPPPTYHLGADAGVDEGEHPLYDGLRARFRSAIGQPKLVSLLGDESYAEFRAARRQPHLDDLDRRLALLEHAFHEHVSDHHGSFGSDVRAFERHLDGGADADDSQRVIVGEVVDAARGGKAVDLGLPNARGKIECWLDGDEVLCSVRLPHGIATTGAPLAPVLEEVVGCAESVGCCGLEVLLLGAHLAPAVAGRRLVGDLCGAAYELGEGVQVLAPKADPGLAAAMALLQRCQRGDKHACRDALSMMHGRGGRLIRDARERLERGQRAKEGDR